MHVRVDDTGRYKETINDDLNQCLSLSANLDQTGRAMIQDAVESLCDEGVIAIAPIETDIDPDSGSFKIYSLRVGKIVEWHPEHVLIRLYDERTGEKKDLFYKKDTVAIIENPLYSVMNEPNSMLRRLIRKLNLLDAIDEQSGSGKLDIIIQLPYALRGEQKKAQAEQRRKEIDVQLSGSKYGIAYIDATEHVTQLNRPAENNLLTQVEYLTKMVFNQLGMTESIFNGTATEEELLNYHNRTIEPFLSALTTEMERKFLTKTARTQGHRIKFFQDPFRLTPVGKIAEIADKFTRNEILSSNEVRAIIGYKPVDDPRADELRNSNINQSARDEQGLPMTTREENEEKVEVINID